MPDRRVNRFDQFSERARRALTLAQEEAQRFNHNYIGTEHLLLGLLRVEDGVAARVLTTLGIKLEAVRSAVEFIIGRGDRAMMGEIGLTPRAKKVIELGVDEARRLNRGYVGTEHLLLGMLREGEGIAAGVLQSLGADLDRVRTETLRALGEPGGAATGREGVAAGYGIQQSILPAKYRPLVILLERLQQAKEAAITAQQYEVAAALRQQELAVQAEIERGGAAQQPPDR